MELFLALLANTVSILLGIIELCFLVHAVLSFFVDEENVVSRFTGMIIEPFVRPVRALLVKMNWLQNSSIDFSFLIACLLVGLVASLL